MKTYFSTGYLPIDTNLLNDDSGANDILTECRKQHADAVTTLSEENLIVSAVVESIKKTRSILLLGMGASHFCNQIATTQFRALGLDCVAVTASEQLASPIQTNDRTVILVSQSGDSAEIIQYLEKLTDRSHHFGLSLSTKSYLKNTLPTMVAAGGRELGFAATRSFLLTLILYASILEGIDSKRYANLYNINVEPQISQTLDSALQNLGSIKSIFFCGRGATEGLAQMAALGCMELGQFPSIGYDIGQFRHGPVEALSTETGVVVLDAGDISDELLGNIGSICQNASSPLILMSSGLRKSCPPNAQKITLPTQNRSLSSVFEMLPTVQALVLKASAARNPSLGIPKFCAKVTDVA